MPPFLKETFGQVKNFWGGMNLSQRILIAGLAVSAIVVFFVLIFWLNQPNYKVLYSRLYKEDAATVVKTLQADKVDYKLTDDGSTILVPEDMVYDLRLKVAGEGKMHGQGLGFELFDEIKVGQTDFVQRINYQRALQGELARTITEFPQVEQARVHLVIPHKSLFIEEQANPTAAVVLKLKEGEKKLEAKQIQGIINLVAMAVEGLEPESITVADTTGNILYSPLGRDSMEGMTTTQLEHKMTIQQNLERRIEQMLFPLFGLGRVIAKVNADLDFSQKTIHKELFDPGSAVVRSEQRSEETQKGSANMEGGVPEANFRGEGFGGSLSQQDSSRETRTTNYEIDKEEQNIISPVGELHRLSVAVIIDGIYETSEGGEEGEESKITFVPRKEAELERIRHLVEKAVGLDEARGDTIEVSCISFGGPEKEITPDLSAIIMDYVHRLGKPFLNGLLIFLFLILVVRPVILALIRPKTEVEEAEGVASLPEGEGRIAITEGEEEEEALDALRKIEDIRAHALQLSEANMDSAMAIIKGWLKEEAA